MKPNQLKAEGTKFGQVLVIVPFVGYVCEEELHLHP
jgi:hypothetical protein